MLYFAVCLLFINRSNFTKTFFTKNVLIAQLVEHKAENFGVVGSNPSQNTWLEILNYTLSTYSLTHLIFIYNNRNEGPKTLHLLLRNRFYIFLLFIFVFPHCFT